MDLSISIGNLSPSDWPVIGSDGDLIGHGYPDLWAVAGPANTSGAGSIRVWPGGSSQKWNSGGSKPRFTGFGDSFDIGTTSISPQRWQLDGSTNDSTNLNNATPFGNPTWGPDSSGSTNKAAVLNGASYFRTVQPPVNTNKSYSVSAWVKLADLSQTQTMLGMATTDHQAFYLGNCSPTAWCFSTTTSNDAVTSYPSAQGPAVAGQWTHLVGVYNADTYTQTLYVNGKAVGTAYNATPVASTSPLTIGGVLSASGTGLYGAATGSVRDVRAYPFALTNEQAAKLASS